MCIGLEKRSAVLLSVFYLEVNNQSLLFEAPILVGQSKAHAHSGVVPVRTFKMQRCAEYSVITTTTA